MPVDLLQLKTELLETVMDAMTELLRTGEPRSASGRVLRAALRQTQSEYGFAGVMHEQTLRILNHEGLNWHDSLNRAFYERSLREYDQVGYLEFTNFNNLFGAVLLTGRPVIANTPERDPRSGGLPPGHPPLRSFLGMPIHSGDRIVGLIGVANRISGYGSAEQDRLEVLAQMAGVIYDSYTRQQRESQLEEHLRQAQRMESVGQLAAGIAHDFNNLLTAIGGYTNLVLEGVDESDWRRADLLEVHKATERAAGLTRQLLAFGRRQILQPRVLDVNGLISGIEKLLGRTIPEDIELVLNLAPELEPVRVDPGQLEQVLLNLAVNARDAMPHGGRLSFLTTTVDVGEDWARHHRPMTSGRYVRLTVSDTGTGMPPETQARIFEPFFTTKALNKGTGLGLATVYGIVKQSGGFIWVSSQVDRGTTFEIYLPVVHEPIELATGIKPRTDTTGGSETILLAEDDGAVRHLARNILTHYGYTVLDGRDGHDALMKAKQHTGVIDLLITDVVMPGLSGRELVARLKTERPGVRVFFTSGYAEDMSTWANIEQGGVALLAKPFLPVDLARKVREVLDAPASASA
jgi:signal transduction histidine kinase/CheY-like chemotaxis protein